METSPKEMVPDPMECGGMETLLLYGELGFDGTTRLGGFKSLDGSSAEQWIGCARRRHARGMV